MPPYNKTERESQPETPENSSPIDGQMAAVLDQIARMNRALLQGSSASVRPSTVPRAIRAFVGAPGAGKTTCLSKWLVRDVLTHGCDASVCRLDCEAADSTNALSVLCESLGIAISRSWDVAASPMQSNQTRFIDLPGTDYNDNARISALGTRLQGFERLEIYVVLNAAYHTDVLAKQARAFATLPISGVILSHCDEIEGTTQLKDISAMLHGMDCPVRFLSSGRGSPGSFEPPEPHSEPGTRVTRPSEGGDVIPAKNSRSWTPEIQTTEGRVIRVHGSTFADIGRYL